MPLGASVRVARLAWLMPLYALRVPFISHGLRGSVGLLSLQSAQSASIYMVAPSAMPTIETGVADLIQSCPSADGRGTLVAVLDTGCDLAAAGLQTTSDGRPKYVDFLDCTGGGDIDTSKKATREADGTVDGLSGRKLKLGSWADGVDEFRVGATRLFALLPSSVRNRITKERKASFEIAQHTSVTKIQRALDGLDKGKSAAKRKDLELLLKEFEGMAKDYMDAGPLLDVLLFQKEGVWRAAVDRSGEGDLQEVIPMAPFRHERQVGDLGFGTELSFCVQVDESGDRLTIVTDAGSHGTHVAGIVAASFEGQPDRDGVAPGAQILACKIGDGRLNSAETGTGLVRALIAAKAAGCDLINLSYGEPFWRGEGGRVAETFDDAVRKWNMHVFTSAGNSGPALSTLGAPGCQTAPITVGAYVSRAMMTDQYSMLPAETVSSTSYSFTSRGPTPDGYMPTLCAPGGAIAPVPRHALQGKAQYHGTSMASPNACGVAACILSALRQDGIEVTPAELRRALENTATAVEQLDPFGQGAGLVNAPAAVEYIQAHHGKPAQHIDFAVTVPSRKDARGLYLRDAAELEGALSFGVKVVPLFEHPAAGRSAAELEELLQTDLDLTLRSTESWVSTPPSMVLLSAKERGGQSFVVRVEAQALPPGAHFARVEALDANDPSRGPLFFLPVTVIVPEPTAPPEQPLELSYELLPGAPARRFLAAPHGAEWATVRLTTGAMPKGPHSVLLHAVPSARGDLPHGHVETKRFLTLREHSEEVIQVPVRGGSTAELTLQLSWLANPSRTSLTATVHFHSYGARGAAMLTSKALRIGAADGYARLEVGAPLGTERLKPRAELEAVERALRPAKSTISAASAALDVLPPSDAERAASTEAAGTQIHQMVLEYKFDVAGEKDKPLNVLPRVQSLHAQLYDSPLDSMLWRLQDADGAVLAYGGAIHDSKPLDLTKGSYTISLLLRHPDRAQLDALAHLPLLLRTTLPKALECPVYSARDAASSRGRSGGKPLAEKWLRRGGHEDLYVASPTEDEAVPSWTAAGDVMVGRLMLDSSPEVATVSAMPLAFELPPQPIKKKEDDVSEEDESGAEGSEVEGAEAEGAEAEGAEAESTEAEGAEADSTAEDEDEEELSKKLLEASLERLKTLRTSGASRARYEKLSAQLLGQNPEHLPLLLEMLAFAKSVPPPEGIVEADAQQAWRAAQVSDAAARLTSAVDPSALALYYGVSRDLRDAADKKLAEKEADEQGEQRAALRSALLARAAALAPASVATATAAGAEGGEPLQGFVDAVREMKGWVHSPEAAANEEEKDALARTLAKYELAMGRPGSALSLMRARLSAATAGSAARKEIHCELADLYRELGMEHWAVNTEEHIFRSFPVVEAPL